MLHVSHGIFYLPPNANTSINKILANGKRFIAYDIIKRLESLKKDDLLEELHNFTTEREKRSGKKHRVFNTSSDIKEILNTEMLITKLLYIHKNPCQGKWMLADDFTSYTYSSASFYELENYNPYITDYRNIYGV